ncbi:MAG: hypothetical protein KatS3mg022_2212 [Armatimonadota bacterium]|nr:MAG: hypothetical protein KatS3mg022_2212 [Armatimonadota bacterium]
MAETLARKERLRRAEPSQPWTKENPNWLFTCLVCGKPITFDEPLMTWTQGNEVRVAHCRCAPCPTERQEERI